MSKPVCSFLECSRCYSKDFVYTIDDAPENKEHYCLDCLGIMELACVTYGCSRLRNPKWVDKFPTRPCLVCRPIGSCRLCLRKFDNVIDDAQGHCDFDCYPDGNQCSYCGWQFGKLDEDGTYCPKCVCPGCKVTVRDFVERFPTRLCLKCVPLEKCELCDTQIQLEEETRNGIKQCSLCANTVDKKQDILPFYTPRDNEILVKQRAHEKKTKNPNDFCDGCGVWVHWDHGHKSISSEGDDQLFCKSCWMRRRAKASGHKRKATSDLNMLEILYEFGDELQDMKDDEERQKTSKIPPKRCDNDKCFNETEYTIIFFDDGKEAQFVRCSRCCTMNIVDTGDVKRFPEFKDEHRYLQYNHQPCDYCQTDKWSIIYKKGNDLTYRCSSKECTPDIKDKSIKELIPPTDLREYHLDLYVRGKKQHDEFIKCTLCMRIDKNGFRHGEYLTEWMCTRCVRDGYPYDVCVTHNVLCYERGNCAMCISSGIKKIKKSKEESKKCIGGYGHVCEKCATRCHYCGDVAQAEKDITNTAHPQSFTVWMHPDQSCKLVCGWVRCIGQIKKEKGVRIAHHARYHPFPRTSV